MVLAAILWLTLSPSPLGEEEIPIFPGADKLVHGIMFFGLSAALLFDTARVSRGGRLSVVAVAGIAAVATGVGVLIEYLQRWMQLGRSFDVIDMWSDAAGALVAASLWILIRSHYNIDYTKYRRSHTGDTKYRRSSNTP